jgi:hypothetical protein
MIRKELEKKKERIKNQVNKFTNKPTMDIYGISGSTSNNYGGRRVDK